MTTATTTKAKTAAKTAVENEMDPRIPEKLATESILASFCVRYLETFDKITEYNKAVLAEKDAEWSPGKVLEKARELAKPTDTTHEHNAEIKKALDDWERAQTALNLARKAVIEKTAAELGIEMSVTAVRDADAEAPLKEERKIALDIGKTMDTISQMTTDVSASESVKEFLAANPLPAVGRDQSFTFGSDGSSTPKYRVQVVVIRMSDDAKVVDESGFTKASLALAKFYERGKGIKATTLREVWEKAGNTGDKTVQDNVTFEDNGLRFTITKK